MDRVIMVPADQAGREELAKESAKLRENPPSETVEGGRYLNTSGEYVNAHGKPVEAPKDAESEPVAAPKGKK